MIGRIRKAVFPVGGLGTRLLPATKAVPKEMLTIIDRPVIQYAVDEARAAGIDHFVFVTGRNNRAIEDHFRIPAELASALTKRGQADTLARIEAGVPQAGETSFTRQQAPLGLGHAIWCARDLIGDEPFAVLLPDVVLRGEPGGLAQILETYSLTGGNVVGITECRPDQASRYGIVALGEKISDDAFRIAAMVEKPKAGTAPSNLKLNGRYILQPRIFEHLARHDVGTGGEIQLTDALLRLAEEQPLFGRRFHGRSFDCGSKEGFIAANVAFALESAELAPIVLHEMDIFLRKPTVSTDPKDRPVQSK